MSHTDRDDIQKWVIVDLTFLYLTGIYYDILLDRSDYIMWDIFLVVVGIFRGFMYLVYWPTAGLG